MNRILIFAGAQESSLLIKKIANNYLNLGEFHIIYSEDEIKVVEEKENLYFYKINFYAFELYKNLLQKDLNKIIIMVKHKKEAEFILNNVKNRSIPILFIKFWQDFEVPKQNNIEVLDIPEQLTNRIIDYLPGVPLFARDIGLGIGEILEVEVPPHSPFVYSHPSKLENEEVKVVAIYRNNELRFIKKETLILPNDKLLIIGKPEALKETFDKIKKNVGAFPLPYGRNIYLLIDMKEMEQKDISQLLKSALYLHRNLKNRKLIIKIINPTLNSRQIYKLYRFNNIDIFTDFKETSYITTLKRDITIFSIGVVVTNNYMFYKFQDIFFDIKIPIFKKGEESLKKCKEVNVILDSKEIKPIAPVIFDLTFQLKKTLNFIDSNIEEETKEIREYLLNFAKLFNFKNVNIKKIDENPILYLKKQHNICIIAPYNEKPIPFWKMLFYPRLRVAYSLLNNFNQFLIPKK